MDLEREIARLHELEERRERLHRDLTEAQTCASNNLSSKDIHNADCERPGVRIFSAEPSTCKLHD